MEEEPRRHADPVSLFMFVLQNLRQIDVLLDDREPGTGDRFSRRRKMIGPLASSVITVTCCPSPIDP